jgi:hypothetical protein
MKLLIWFIFLIKLIASLKREDYCYKIEDCKNNKHLFDCGHGICSIDRNKCKKLAMFFLVKNFLIEDYLKYKNKQNTFLSQIKNCSRHEAIWNPNEVCLNTKYFLKPSLNRLWSNQVKSADFKCNGNYSYKCKTHYCTMNKQACDGLKVENIKIKKC